ncbi:MAG: Hsp20/alpha crystallin family protein [Steroidobacteraceae bacterium]
MSSRITRGWMWAEAVERMQQAERLQRQFFRCGDAAASWEPPADIIGRQNEVVVTVALPGVAPELVQVVIEGVTLAITALRQAPMDGHTTHIHRLEIPYGRFERRITLPPAHYELVEQLFQHGCLSLRLIRQG